VFDTEQTSAVTLVLYSNWNFVGTFRYERFPKLILFGKGGNVQSQPLSHAAKAVSHDDDVYCADPRCVYCKDLRVAEEQWKRAQKQERRAQSV
jgi:hypothetical protein